MARIQRFLINLQIEQTIYNAAMKTKGSAGLSGIDAEIEKILSSKNFSNEGKLLTEEEKLPPFSVGKLHFLQAHSTG